MAKLRLNSEERIRITADFKENTFIDVCGHKDELGMSVEFYPSMQYIEIRKKGGVCNNLYLKRKDTKNIITLDFGKMQKLFFLSTKYTII